MVCKGPSIRRIFQTTVLEVEKDFIEAAKSNDVEGMKLLGRGVNVNAKNVVCQ